MAQNWLKLGRIAAILAGMVASLAPSGVLAQFAGRYVGLDAAQGMRIEMEAPRGGQARGTLRRADGSTVRFSGEVVGDTLEASFTEGGVRTYLRLLAEPIGVLAVLVPFDAQNQLRVDQTETLAFIREGVSMPAPPERFLPPPDRPVPYIDPQAFVSSYPFWPPRSVAMAYEGLEPRFRSVVKLFPVVQADLLWKLCASPERTPGIAEALRGQGLTCGDVDSVFRAMQAGDGFDRFKRSVAAESRLLMQTLGCADDRRRNDAACRKAAQETARRATSMETAGTVLARYR
jgi:hypothetical protein